MEVVARDAVEVRRRGQQAEPDRIDDGCLTTVVLADEEVRSGTELQTQAGVCVAVLPRRRTEDPKVLRVQTSKVQRLSRELVACALDDTECSATASNSPAARGSDASYD